MNLNHGSFSMTQQVQSVDPWLLSHGVLFIVNFSVLMPLATYLILADRDKYYQLHCVLGILITALLVAGWACLAGQTLDKNLGYVYDPMSDSAVALSHKATGIVARFVAVVVCIVGVILGVLKMPKTVRYAVRISHGVGGVGISIFGPTVVWNGFVRLQPFMPAIGFFTSTPVLWYSLVIVLVPLYVWNAAKSSCRKAQIEEPTEMVDIEKSLNDLTIPEIVELMKSDKDDSIFLFFGEYLVQIPSLFEHPGGTNILREYSGKDITRIFSGEESFDEAGRLRIFSHSADAIRQLLLFRVGRVASPVFDASTTMGLSRDESFGFGGMLSIDEEGRCLGVVVSKTVVNTSSDFPVISFIVKVEDKVIFSNIVPGMKVRVGIECTDAPLIKRTYTVVSVDPNQQSIQLIVKIYADGKLSPKLASLTQGDVLNFSSLSSPPVMLLSPDQSLLLLVAGTGIVPILYYISKATCSRVSIVWSLRKPQDIFCVEEINAAVANKLLESDTCKTIEMKIHFTGETVPQYASPFGLYESVEIINGRIDLQILIAQFEDLSNVRTIMSGPKQFVTGMHASLTSLGVDPSHILSLD